MDGGKQVLVTDPAGHFLDSTHPGKARILLRKGKAEMISIQPPMIRLNRIVNVDRGGIAMKKILRKQDLHKYFKEQEEIIVQNISGGVVCLTIYHPNTTLEEHMRIENNRYPIILTDKFPKDWLTASTDLRHMLTRNPPTLHLLTRDEYDGLLSTIAKQTKKTVEEVKETIAVAIDQAQDQTPAAKDAPDLDEIEHRQKDLDIPGESNEVSSRVLQISSQCASDLPEDRRMTADAALTELDVLNLNLVDLNYLAANPYKTIRVWAQQQLNAMLSTPPEEPKVESSVKKSKNNKVHPALEPAPVPEAPVVG